MESGNNKFTKNSSSKSDDSGNLLDKPREMLLDDRENRVIKTEHSKGSNTTRSTLKAFTTNKFIKYLNSATFFWTDMALPSRGRVSKEA